MGWAAEEFGLDSWQRQEIPPPQLYKASGLPVVSTQPLYSMSTKNSSRVKWLVFEASRSPK